MLTPLSDVEAEALGRRWLAAGGLLARGMFVRHDQSTRNHRMVEQTLMSEGWWPDLRDAATRGAALEVVRERWGGDVWVQGMVCYPPADGPPLTRHGPMLRWVVGGLHYADGQRVNGAGPDGFGTEVEALVAALEARHAL